VTRRLMFVHAHPDDEASKGAATAARYVDEGAEVVLVTCTGGEAGEVLNPSADPVPAERMPEVRARELAAAVRAIGFTASHRLGYRDSGYHEDPDELPEGCFARQPVDGPASGLAGLVRRHRPHVVVTYPEDGGYPHPDHIMNHRVTMRALELAEDPTVDEHLLGGASAWRVPKVYASTIFPAERMRLLHEALVERGIDSPFARRLERADADEPDARVPCADRFDRRDAALRAHVTQIDPDGWWFQVPRELERELYPYEAYLLLRSDVEVQRPEEDLFAGLDVDATGRDVPGSDVS